MIDAHVHFDFSKNDPVKDIIDVYFDNKLTGIVLILNTPREVDLFFNNLERFEGINYHIALIADVNNPSLFFDNSSILQKAGIPFSAKVHSRITGITSKDFDAVGDMIERTSVSRVIVDGFYYGANLENLCFNELAIYLAKRFPEKSIIMAHFGGIKILDCMFTTRCLSNVYYDISLTVKYLEGTSVWKDILHCCKFCSNRVMYGSDYPDFGEEESVQAFMRLFANETDDLKGKILEKNASRIYFGE